MTYNSRQLPSYGYGKPSSTLSYRSQISSSGKLVLEAPPKSMQRQTEASRIGSGVYLSAVYHAPNPYTNAPYLLKTDSGTAPIHSYAGSMSTHDSFNSVSRKYNGPLVSTMSTSSQPYNIRGILNGYP